MKQCDGRRPKCHECVSRESQCQYTETETAILKRKHEDLETLFDMLKSFPEPEANNLLARVRAGTDPSLLVEQVRHGSLLMQMLSSSQGGATSLESPTAL
jgi:adenine-specific DNA glycosylase